MTAIVSKEGRESTPVLRLGPIPFAKEAICGLNELGRMSFDDQAPLLDVMEEGEFSLNKHGLNAHIRSPTVIIGSANPTGSKWSNMSSDGRINMDDIPAIKPLLDRFDYVFVIKTSRDEQAIRDYANARSKYEDIPVPNYNPYLEKHLIFAKRFNPKMSKEATIMLNEYYVGIAKIVGSPRVRDTIFRTAKMIARLKLKNFVDVDDAKEACQFYNVILNEYDHIVNIPADPKEVSFIEFLYTIEATQAPILFEEAVSQTCKRNEYVATYIGNSYKLRNNKKLRQILDRLLEDSRIKRVQTKPIILQWISKDQPKKGIHSNKGKNNREDPSDDVTNVTHVTRSQVHTDEKDSLQDKNFLKKAEGKDVTRAHRAHRSYSIEEDSRYRQLENAKYEFEMGLYKEYGIKKAGNWWTCTYPKCSIKGHDKFAAAIHVMNVHETEEVKANLGILKGDSQDTQQRELRQYSREQLDMLLAQAEHGSPLEKEILLARDDLIDGGRS